MTNLWRWSWCVGSFCCSFFPGLYFLNYTTVKQHSKHHFRKLNFFKIKMLNLAPNVRNCSKSGSRVLSEYAYCDLKGHFKSVEDLYISRCQDFQATLSKLSIISQYFIKDTWKFPHCCWLDIFLLLTEKCFIIETKYKYLKFQWHDTRILFIGFYCVQGKTEDEMVGRHHRLGGHEFE